MSIQSATKQFDDELASVRANITNCEESLVRDRAKETKLVSVIEHLKSVFKDDDLTPAPKKPGRTTKTKHRSELPATSAEFWTGLLAATPQKTDAIMAAAVTALGGITGEDNITALRKRMTSFLQTASKDGKIKSEGQRNDRVYFL